MGTKTDDRVPDSGPAGRGLNNCGDPPRPDDLRPRPSVPEPPVTRAERLTVLVALGSTDAPRGLRELNAKALAIVDAIALGLRADLAKLKRAAFVFECWCGASFGTRAENLEQAISHASEHGWRIVMLRGSPRSVLARAGDTMATCCDHEAAGGGSPGPGRVEGGPAPRGERSSVHPVHQVLDAIDTAIDTYVRAPLPTCSHCGKTPTALCRWGGCK